MRRTFLTLGESAGLSRDVIVWTNGDKQDTVRFAIGSGAGQAYYFFVQAEQDLRYERGAMAGEEGGGLDSAPWYALREEEDGKSSWLIYGYRHR